MRETQSDRYRRLTFAHAALGACSIAALAALAVAGAPVAQAAERSFDGTVVERHSDDFSDGRAHYTYLLDRPRGSTLRLTGALRSLEAGAEVRLDGSLEGSTLDVSGVHPDSGASSARADARAPAVHKVAVIMLNFANDRSEPWTAAQARQKVFTDANSVNAYFEEQSTGTTTLQGRDAIDGDVYGWYQIADPNSGCDYGGWASAADAMAASQGANLSGYDHYVYIWPSASSCGWAGLAYVPGDTVYINGSLTLRVISHELGHNIGVHHASSYRCTSGGQRVFIGGSCTKSEYGDPFSVMGASSTNHSVAWHKAQMDYISGSSIATVTATGNYSIAPSEQSLPGQTQLLRVRRTASDYYYLDYRQPFGSYFDNFNAGDPIVNGVAIRIAPELSSIVQTKLLDANPATTTFTDAPLAIGQSATDSGTGTKFTTVSASATEAVVRIELGGGTLPSDPATSPGNQTSPPDNPTSDGPRISYRARQSSGATLVRTRKLVLRAGCDQTCSLAAAATLRTGRASANLRRSRGRARAGRSARLELRLSGRALRLARRAKRRGRRIRIDVAIVAVNADGESSTVVRRLTLRR